MEGVRILRPEGGTYKPTGKNMTMTVVHAAILSAMGSIDSLCQSEGVLNVAKALNNQPKDFTKAVDYKELKKGLELFNKTANELITYLEAHSDKK